MSLFIQPLIGLSAAILISLLAYRAHSLSLSGTVAAALIGAIIFGFGGWQWAIILLTFFISSSLLTRLFKSQKTEVDEKFAKGGQRDAGQVMANGGIASIFAALSFFFPTASWTWWAFTAAMAAVNADTWATELGVLNPAQPRLITSGKPVERGASGGISLYGTVAALAGAGLIAALGTILTPYSFAGSFLLPFACLTLAGFLGALFDSLLGASVQGIYYCVQCQKETERHPKHLCGSSTRQLRGWGWLNNDLVNLACATTAVGFMLIFFPVL